MSEKTPESVGEKTEKDSLRENSDVVRNRIEAANQGLESLKHKPLTQDDPARGKVRPAMSDESEVEKKLREERHHKGAKLAELGVNPYGNGYRPEHLTADILAKHANDTPEALEAAKPGPYTIAGRVVSVRDFGKAGFIMVQDRTGALQVHVKKDVLGDAAFAPYKLLDIGDFVFVKGTAFRSKTGELTLAASEYRPLTKTLRAMPGKFSAEVKLSPEQTERVKVAVAAIHAATSEIADVTERHAVSEKTIADQQALMKDDPVAAKALPHAVAKAWAEKNALHDTEERYRRRYVDLMSNASVRETFVKRTKLVQYIRSFLDARGYLEVETPMMHPLVSGAAARPFVTHHNVYDVDLFMRIAPELYLKRLVVGGFDRVYEINRNFRNEGVSTRHNPEFTMLEFYEAYATYDDLMDLTEEMISGAAVHVTGSTKVKYGEHVIDFGKGWPRIPMRQSILDRVKDLKAEDFANVDKLRTVAMRRAETPADKAAVSTMNAGELMGTLFEQYVEGELINPTFITEFPVENSPLARRNDKDPTITDRFELFCMGREIANAFSELNDPVDQEQRFRAQVDAKGRGQQETMDYDADYIRALEHGLPPTAGEGIGIDRLCMLLTDAQSIRDVILFPLLRPNPTK
ncbi:MAG: lysine--tRNA ligase [Myxococcales bacterium]|nr:lysine--tRNA ligase [Myxococcales bacterium]